MNNQRAGSLFSFLNTEDLSSYSKCSKKSSEQVNNYLDMKNETFKEDVNQQIESNPGVKAYKSVKAKHKKDPSLALNKALNIRNSLDKLLAKSGSLRERCEDIQKFLDKHELSSNKSLMKELTQKSRDAIKIVNNFNNSTGRLDTNKTYQKYQDCPMMAQVILRNAWSADLAFAFLPEHLKRNADVLKVATVKCDNVETWAEYMESSQNGDMLANNYGKEDLSLFDTKGVEIPAQTGNNEQTADDFFVESTI